MTTKLMSKTLKAINKRIEDVLLKSRMREIFKSGSVRELIVTLGLLPHQKVRYGLYSTDHRVNISLCPLCSLWFFVQEDLKSFLTGELKFVSRTTNPIENYHRTTMPDSLKGIFKNQIEL